MFFFFASVPNPVFIYAYVVLIGLMQPGSSGFSSSAATGGADGSRFGARVGQGAAGQYGGPYASVYGTQQVVS